MKAITLTQPWATLVAIGAKKIETRNWSTHYRGPIAIHAAKGFPASAREFCGARMVRDALGWPEFQSERISKEWLRELKEHVNALPIGCVIATANLVRCVTTEVIRAHVKPFTEQEELFGDYSPRRFGFLLENVVRLPEPIPAKGALSLWEWNG